jgi:GNAT superfamily N-acetyltransferase
MVGDDSASVEWAEIVPYGTGDLAEVLDLLERCSRETLFHRFHGFSDGVAWATGLGSTEPRQLAVCARVRRRCVGIANLIRSTPTTVELGVLVEDRWQRRGIGGALVAELLEIAKAERVVTVHADVLFEDRFAVRMLRRHGPIHARIDGGVCSVDVELSSADVTACRTPRR